MANESGKPPPDLLLQLSAAERAAERARSLVREAAPHNARFVSLMGLIVAGLGLAVGLTEHAASHVGLIAALGTYPILLSLLVWWRQQTKRATGRGWSRRTAGALGLTMTFYGFGVPLAAFGLIGPRLAFWLPYALLTATPALVAARTKPSRS